MSRLLLLLLLLGLLQSSEREREQAGNASGWGGKLPEKSQRKGMAYGV